MHFVMWFVEFLLENFGRPLVQKVSETTADSLPLSLRERYARVINYVVDVHDLYNQRMFEYPDPDEISDAELLLTRSYVSRLEPLIHPSWSAHDFRYWRMAIFDPNRPEVKALRKFLRASRKWDVLHG